MTVHEYTERFTEQDTSEDRVITFLNETNDYQVFHREKRVIPGAFYLTLASQHMDSMPNKLSVDFKDLRFYPFSGSIEVTKNNGSTNFRIYDNFGDIANISASTNHSQPQENIVFAYKLPGVLLDAWTKSRKLKDGFSAIYNSQEIDFTSYSPEDEILIENELADGRNFIVPVSCLDNSKRRTLEARANVRILPTNVLEKLIGIQAKKLGRIQ